MANKRAKGLYKRGSTWHIDRMVHGERIRESTGESDFDRAFEVMVRRINQEKDGHVAGKRPIHRFKEAFDRYLFEYQGRTDSFRSFGKKLVPALGHLALDQVNDSTLRPVLDDYRGRGCKHNTLGRIRALVSAILSAAATRWHNQNGTTWLDRKPSLESIPVTDQLPPYPITWREEELLLSMMRPYHQEIVRFATNTGLRDNEIRELRWDWEYLIQELDDSVFVIPSAHSKNRKSRLVVLNSHSREILNNRRGVHPDFVFTSRFGRPYRTPMNESFFQKAKVKALASYQQLVGQAMPDGFLTLHFHDLRHTFGHRLLSAGVSHDLRSALLGHSTHRGQGRYSAMTAHYSAVDYMKLRAAVESICDPNFRNSPTLPALRLVRRQSS